MIPTLWRRFLLELVRPNKRRVSPVRNKKTYFVPCVTILEDRVVPSLVISEFRLRGPNGANDEFVELYNNTNAPITVASVSGTGFGVAASDGVLRFTIPNGTIIPARGHYLGANTGYTYSSYPAGNGITATSDATTYSTDIPDNAGIALFDTNVPADFILANRLDAVGSASEANTLYKEGTGYSDLTPFSIEYSFTRLYTNATVTNPPFAFGTSDGLPIDTDNNAHDFLFVDTNGTAAGAGQRLGAPGPENLSSPIALDPATLNFTRSPLDNAFAIGAAPNKVRDFTSVPALNSTFGTIDLRRTFTNNTGAPVTRLRFRIFNIATFPAASGIADLRPMSSSDVVVSTTGGNVTVFGTTLEVDNTAPSTGQPNGGGFNSTMADGNITLGTPLAAGASTPLRFLFGLQQTGSYKIGIVLEALPGAANLWEVQGNTEDASDTENGADLQITKTDGVTSATPGGTVTYTIMVTNAGSDAVTGAHVSDTFPALLTGVLYSAAQSGGASGFTPLGGGNISDTVDMPVGSTITYTVNATVSATATGVLSNTATVTVPASVNDPNPANNTATDVDLLPAPLLISEFRVRGPSGANDEFVEIYNNSPADQTVQTADGSAGYAVVASDGTARFVIPNGTVIPARGHYLGANSNAYSLSGYGAADVTYTTDIPDNAGIALFRTATVANFTLANRLDAVGSTSEANTLYKEGTGYPALTPFSIDYSFYRDLRTTGLPKDTDNNAADFLFVDTNGTSAGAGQRLGAPGPENLASPRANRTGVLPATLLDPSADPTAPPNRVIDPTSVPAQNSTFGTISVRRTITNNTGSSLTSLRFRIVDITTFPSPSGTADLRPRTSSDVVVGAITVHGTTLDQPPTQPNGSGFNGTLSVPAVSVGTPLAPGASISVQFLLGVQQVGNIRFFVETEGLADGSFDVFGDSGVFLPFTDSFTQANGSTLTDVWTQQVGNYTINSNQASSIAPLDLATVVGVNALNVVVQADVTLPMGSNTQVGVLARYTGSGDTADMYWGMLFRLGGTTFGVILRHTHTPDSWSILSSGPVAGNPLSGKLRFEVIGNSLKLFLNGALLRSTVDATPLAAGSVGMRSIIGTQIDNFSAKAVFSDTFTQANGTGLSSAWTPPTGSFTVQSNAVVTGNGLNQSSVANLNEAAVHVEADVTVVAGAAMGLTARQIGANYLFGALIDQAGITYAAIYRHGAGGFTLLSTIVAVPGNPKSGKLAFDLTGTSVSLSLDGVAVVSAVGSLVSGSVGMLTIGGGIFDNFQEIPRS